MWPSNGTTVPIIPYHSPHHLGVPPKPLLNIRPADLLILFLHHGPCLSTSASSHSTELHRLVLSLSLSLSIYFFCSSPEYKSLLCFASANHTCMNAVMCSDTGLACRMGHIWFKEPCVFVPCAPRHANLGHENG